MRLLMLMVIALSLSACAIGLPDTAPPQPEKSDQAQPPAA
jgi:hypothetical protein